jgi:tetratricopeptide (TPR) repeat protein
MHSALHLSHLGTRLAGSLLVLALLGSTAATPAAAQGVSAPRVADRVELVELKTRQPGPDSPPTDIQFDVVVNYTLQSVDDGFMLLFLFENNSESSKQESSNGIPVKRGSGQLVLHIDYTLRSDVRNLTLIAGLFRPPQRLLAWVSTNPMDIAPWPGRVAFDKALTARLANDFDTADKELTAAIKASPDIGNYYYWRGDTRVRLDRYDDAIADFSRALELMPKDRASRVGRGIAVLWHGDPQAALGDLTAAIDTTTRPDRIEAWALRARGVANASLGNTREAVDDYRAYLTLVPDAADRAQIEAWIADLA